MYICMIIYVYIYVYIHVEYNSMLITMYALEMMRHSLEQRPTKWHCYPVTLEPAAVVAKLYRVREWEERIVTLYLS